MNSLLLIVASNLVVACCIAIVAYSAGRWSRSSALAHVLWMAVFIKLITPPIVLAPISVPSGWSSHFESVYSSLAIAPQEPASAENAAQADASSAEPVAIQSTIVPPNRVLSAIGELTLTRCLVSIWLIGTVVICIRGMVRFVQFSRLLVREGAVDEEATAVVARLAAGRCKSVPKVRRIAARVSPMLFGVGRTTCIVCPKQLWVQLTESQRESFLAHEVAHFLRRDHWVRWLEWFVTAVYWWFPLVYLARQQLERHEEAACDAWAVSRLKAPKRAYAETLLNVVDFLSENRVGVPRLASRMQATDSLEERLRLIMTVGDHQHISTMRCGLLVTSALALLLIHPIPRAAGASSVSRSIALMESSESLVDSPKSDIQTEPSSMPAPLVSLPPVPRGWWNEPPARTWAEVRIGDNDLKLLAEAGVGISLLQSNQSQHVFDPQSIRAIAHVASSGRLIIGNANGELHLWDVGSSQAVSLIGRHPDCITSIAYHPKGGLVSGDSAGNIIAWDIQSGQIKGSTSVSGQVCSVRWAARGDQLAVVVGDWASVRSTAMLLMIDGNSLATSQRLDMPHDVALVQQHANRGWLAVDWSGTLWSLVTGKAIGKINKESVSGATLCQEVLDRTDFFATRPKLEINDE